jgi:hypothetical protein
MVKRTTAMAAFVASTVLAGSAAPAFAGGNGKWPRARSHPDT